MLRAKTRPWLGSNPTLSCAQIDREGWPSLKEPPAWDTLKEHKDRGQTATLQLDPEGEWITGKGMGWERVGALSRMAPKESSGNKLGPGSGTLCE